MVAQPASILHCREAVRVGSSSEAGSAEPAPAPEASSPSPSTPQAPVATRAPPGEVVYYEGSGGSNVELALSLALTATLIFAPLTMASIGLRFWLNYRFTNRRIVIQNTSSLFKSEFQITYDQIKEVRAAPRGFGAWGDMVVFTKRGERLELIGMGNYMELKDYIERQMYRIE
ncbi:hypothetical protein FOA52_000248 [Chlamydomonas sp. UWO 241]|nr:hypothetical protein FOA52_000248 [Chlamydomonas sp. UWO 241]